MSDCLDKIIGLSETTCPCFDEGKPEDANESASGIWLDQLDGFNLKVADSASDCGKGSLWERMERAVRDAKLETKKDILGCIGATYKPRYEIFSGQIGQPDFKSALNLTTDYAGVKVAPAQLRGAYVYLKRIGIIVNASVPVTVEVYSTEGYSETQNGKLVASYTTPGNVVANQLTWLSLTSVLELPMFSYNCRLDYYVLLKLDGTFQPVDNKIDCGCGGVQRPWLSWLNVSGTKGSDVNNIRSFTNTDKIFNGVILDLEVKCKTEELICNSERPLDFVNDAYAKYLAYAVRFRAAAKLYSDLLSTDNIDRQTMMNRDEMKIWMNEWQKNYLACINYLCSLINVGNNDCLVCKDLVGFKKTGIKI